MKSNVYTRTGDNGTTSLVGGTRIAKNNIRLEAYGTVDELNSWLGLLDSSTAIPPEQHQVLTNAMHRLFDIGSALATEAESTWQPAPMPDSVVEHLEATIDSLDANLPRHNRFILPGGPPRRRAGQYRAGSRTTRRTQHNIAGGHRSRADKHSAIHKPP